MLTLAPLVLARDCFRADAVGPPATETAATTWSLADCTTLDFSCTGNSSVPAAESGKLCENALQADEVASLTEALKSDAPNLVSLELRGNWVGPLKGAALATALQAHPSLEFLGLASTALGDVGGTALARRLLLQDAPPALRRIDLSHNHLGDDCARALEPATAPLPSDRDVSRLVEAVPAVDEEAVAEAVRAITEVDNALNLC